MKLTLKFDRFTDSEKLFFFSYILYLIPNILSLSFYQKYIGSSLKGCVALALLLLALREVTFERARYSKKRIFVAAIFSALILISWNVGQGIVQKDVAIMLMFVYAGRDIPFKKICRVTLWISTAVLFFVIVSADLGIITNYISSRANGVEREYLGFRYVLYPAMLLYNIAALAMYQNREKTSYIESIILFMANYWVYTRTNARLSFILTLLVILLPYIIKTKPFARLMKSKICGILCAGSFAFCCFASLWLSITYSYNVEWKRNLNTFLSGRLRYGQSSLLEYGYSLFGIKGITWYGYGLNAQGKTSLGTNTYNYVDSFYIQVLQRYGIIVLAILLFFLTVSVYLFWKRKDYGMVMILVILAFHGIIDDLILKLYYNTFWFAIGVILINKSQDYFDNRNFHRVRKPAAAKSHYF